MTLVGYASTGFLVILGLCSVVSVAIMLNRHKAIARAEAPKDFQLPDQLVAGGADYLPSNPDSFLQGAVAAMWPYRKDPQKLASAYRQYTAMQKPKLEDGLTTLGTLGANAPFIGLLGTVLGIVQAFGQLSSQQIDNSLVMASIAEALLHTALGLFVAIPAVIAYNGFVRRLQNLQTRADVLKEALLQRGQ